MLVLVQHLTFSAGLVTLNTMTLMPLLLAGAAFAKVAFKLLFFSFSKGGFITSTRSSFHCIQLKLLECNLLHDTDQGYLIGNLKHRKASSGHGGYGPPLGYNR